MYTVISGYSAEFKHLFYINVYRIAGFFRQFSSKFRSFNSLFGSERIFFHTNIYM